jgi:cytoskeletal protein RodZ
MFHDEINDDPQHLSVAENERREKGREKVSLFMMLAGAAILVAVTVFYISAMVVVSW